MKRITRLLLLFIFAIASQVQAALPSISNAEDLSAYIGDGKWVVVLFWGKDCHVCAEEAPAYIRYHESQKDKNTRMLGISIDGKSNMEGAEAFIKRHNITFDNIIGEPNQMADMFTRMTDMSWIGTPTIMIFDPKGTLKAATPGAVPPDLIKDYISKNSQ